MTDKTTEELAADHFEARKRLECLAMMNMAGLDYEGQKKLAIEYALAQEEVAVTGARLRERTGS